MVVFPNAKINIGLTVKSKREDGFHIIESVFYPINWLDILEINESHEFKFTSSGLNIDGDSDNNLVVKAYNLLFELFPNIIKPCHIHLHKQIPMGAGLGGGSADAAYTLVLLNNMFELGLNQSRLEELADRLGSDCAFFIENTPKFVTGKGEILADIDFSLKGFYLKVVNPGIHVSTKTAFENLLLENNSLEKELILNQSPNKWKDHITNDFEKSVMAKHPIISDIKERLSSENAIYTSMTGTGSTVYAIYDKKPESTFTDYTEKIIEL
jgi:4-diphosphocytidyl-2-C-methyl-D-erythritol kinase